MADNNNAGLGCIEIGQKLNVSKKHIAKIPADGERPVAPGGISGQTLAERVESFLRSLGDGGVIASAHGRRVNLASVDDYRGKPATVLQRAEHLTTRHVIGTPRANRLLDTYRVDFVWAVPNTIINADVVAEAPSNSARHGRVFYFKNYVDGLKQKTHLVITDMRGGVVDHGVVDDLLTQHQANLKQSFDGAVVRHKRETPKLEASHSTDAVSLLIPPAMTKSSRSATAHLAEPTDTNPHRVGVPLSTA